MKEAFKSMQNNVTALLFVAKEEEHTRNRTMCLSRQTTVLWYSGKKNSENYTFPLGTWKIGSSKNLYEVS